ncbi:hypothetical protein DPMN_150814 [Dreissena polymorpha]|uniref:Uncharacterized protein n=1 Tax=Dreissena polymorpha TaxID=45954 RepID=A0A9D4FK01_DREPO|nr:hypothetical protein DPMN_150814 [Dreissena polymorpha]
MKHKVKIRILQDKRNVFSLTFEAEVDHPNRQWQTENERSVSPPEEKKHEQDLFAMEGDIMAMVFRGNVDMSTKEKLVFSFHGYRGVRRHFEIKVANPMSQRSMQTYHGALQLFVYAEKRYTAFDRSLTPSVKNGWTLRAEFPLLIPKYEKTTPVMVNRAAVSIRFQGASLFPSFKSI